MTPLGDHEVRIAPTGDRLTSGECAACGGRVEEGEPHVILYSLAGWPGGLFHFACDPRLRDPRDWYSVEGEV
jgi:hypothetical protein